GRVGGVCGAVALGDGASPSGIGCQGAAGEVPQASPWPEAAAPEAGKWGEDHPRLHSEGTGGAGKADITPPSGAWADRHILTGAGPGAPSDPFGDVRGRPNGRHESETDQGPGAAAVVRPPPATAVRTVPRLLGEGPGPGAVWARGIVLRRPSPRRGR